MTTDAHDLYVEASGDGNVLIINAWSRSGRSVSVRLDLYLLARVAHHFMAGPVLPMCPKTYRQAEQFATSELHNVYAQGRLHLTLVGDHWDFE